MIMIVTTKKRHKDIAEGTQAERIKKEGQVMYQFEGDGNLFDHISFSWNYIQKRKHIFDVSRGKQED